MSEATYLLLAGLHSPRWPRPPPSRELPCRPIGVPPPVPKPEHPACSGPIVAKMPCTDQLSAGVLAKPVSGAIVVSAGWSPAPDLPLKSCADGRKRLVFLGPDLC